MFSRTSWASWDLARTTPFSFTAVCILLTLDWSLGAQGRSAGGVGCSCAHHHGAHTCQQQGRLNPGGLLVTCSAVSSSFSQGLRSWKRRAAAEHAESTENGGNRSLRGPSLAARQESTGPLWSGLSLMKSPAYPTLTARRYPRCSFQAAEASAALAAAVLAPPAAHGESGAAPASNSKWLCPAQCQERSQPLGSALPGHMGMQTHTWLSHRSTCPQAGAHGALRSLSSGTAVPGSCPGSLLHSTTPSPLELPARENLLIWGHCSHRTGSWPAHHHQFHHSPSYGALVPQCRDNRSGP